MDRTAGTIFTLSTWHERAFCYRGAKRGYPSLEEARALAKKPGKYLLTRVTDRVRTDLETFEIPTKGSK